MELLPHLLDPCSCLLLLLLAMLHVAAAGNEVREKGRGAGARGTEYHPVQFTMHEIIHILFFPLLLSFSSLFNRNWYPAASTAQTRTPKDPTDGKAEESRCDSMCGNRSSSVVTVHWSP